MLRRLRLITAAGLPALALLSATPACASILYTANLSSLNNSGVTGTANFILSDDRTTLTLNLQASGLEPNQMHMGHIHGLFSNGTTGTPVQSMVPTLAQDTDRDGFVELAEGQVTYGPIVVPFQSLMANASGVLSFSQTFNLLDPSTYANGYSRTDLLGPDLSSLNLREVVLHGMTVPAGVGAGTPGEVNGTGGYLAALPVAAGTINRVNSAVPEPASWALMLLGFGGVGVSIRRQRTRTTSKRLA